MIQSKCTLLPSSHEDGMLKDMGMGWELKDAPLPHHQVTAEEAVLLAAMEGQTDRNTRITK